MPPSEGLQSGDPSKDVRALWETLSEDVDGAKRDAALSIRPSIDALLGGDDVVALAHSATFGDPNAPKNGASTRGRSGGLVGGETFPADGVAMTWLPTIEIAGPHNTGEPVEYQLLDELGHGGMGIVYRAIQRSLDREVAVKKTTTDSARAKFDALLYEARITGKLEHPNVVPIHGFGLDKAGHPVLVMKRIEGDSWTRLIHEPHLCAQPEALQNPIEYHVRILMQVCQALAFAHSRGVIHRDIKPDNVMVGQFGEVYLLDWGVALQIDLVDQSKSAHVVGTPVYMSPEQACSEPADARTDVYLLGAVLHELLDGAAPHTGSTIIEVLKSAYRSAPRQYGDTVPEELAQICRRLMARDPDDRYASAKDVRKALAEFLSHQQSTEIVRDAVVRLKTLNEALERDDDSIQRLFSECTVAFELALRTWSDNPDARAGLRQARVVMATHELEHGNWNSASRVLSSMREPPADLRARIAEAQAAAETKRERLARLEELARQSDGAVGAKERGKATVRYGIVFAIAAAVLIPLSLTSNLELTLPILTWVNGIGLAGMILMTPVFFRMYEPTKQNRRLHLWIVVVLAYTVLSRLGSMSIGLSTAEAMQMEMVGSTMSCALFATAFDSRVWKPAAFSLIASILVFALPNYAAEIAGIGELVPFIWIGAILVIGGMPSIFDEDH